MGQAQVVNATPQERPPAVADGPAAGKGVGRGQGARPHPQKPKGDGRVKRVCVSGAGLEEANGTYTLTEPFAGAERFMKETSRGSVYIRRLADEERDTWLITLSASGSDSGHLYKREEVRLDRDTPPLFGWEVCEFIDGVDEGLAPLLGDAPARLEYRYGFVAGAKGSKDEGDEEQPPDTATTRDTNSPPSPRKISVDSLSSSLQVSIMSASNLPLIAGLQPYCSCEVLGRPRTRIETPPKDGCCNPEWNTVSEVPSFKEGDELLFCVRSKDKLLGRAILRHDDLFPSGFIGDVPLESASPDASQAMLSLCITLPSHEMPGIRLRIDKDAGQIGMHIVPEMQKDALSIRKIIEGGLVQQWNAANPMRQIKRCDRIVEVNGRRGTCRELLTELAESKGEVEMLVKRSMPLSL